MGTFLVVAASSGIGSAAADLLLKAGHSVLTTARNTDKINPDFLLDASDFDAVDHVFDQCGPLDGVVNCAGSLLLKPAHLTSRAQFDDVMEKSLVTCFAVMRSAGKYMQNGGSVVFISSAAAMEGIANHEAIAAAKAGVLGLMLSSAATYASSNIRVNAVAPGLVETPLTAGLVANETSRKFSENMHALGRLGQTGDIARAITFLLDPENSWITGQVIAVDGGLSRVRPKVKA